MKILGIDPGTAITGYGVIETPPSSSSPPRRGRGMKGEGGVRLVAYGCIRTAKSLDAASRLWEIYQDLNKLIKKYRPQIIAVEQVYFYTNVKTAIGVAQARGVVLLAAAQNHKRILEFTPLQVKNSLTSYGKADKKQVQYMVKKLLRLKHTPKPDDAADALALAICATQNKI